jgi:hypothetical protein
MRRSSLFILLAVTASAQQYDTMRARISGNASSDRGKCTIEVVVDGVAEIEVTGAEGRMRTLTGARATWRRMDCNMPLPPAPTEFHFSAQTGRGSQKLVSEPTRNNGIAMVRIEDGEGGAEGYKFDLEWRGGSIFNNGGGGFSNSAPPPANPSIFNAPAPAPTPNPNYGVIDTTTTAGWKDQVNFRGRGDGYYRNFRGADELLNDVVVTIERTGRVQVELGTNQRDRLMLTGRLVVVDNDHLAANMQGSGLNGSLEILLDSRNRVQELAMTGVGRNRFELRWQSK